MDRLKQMVKEASKEKSPKRGWCHYHRHYCAMLDVNRVAARNLGALLLVTSEEKKALYNCLDNCQDSGQ